MWPLHCGHYTVATTLWVPSVYYTETESVYLIHNWLVHNVLGPAGISQGAEGFSITGLSWRHS